MKREILLYGFIGGLLITVLKWSEYRFLVLEHSGEIYGALIAAIFAVLGIWLGMRFRRGQRDVPVVPPPAPVSPNTVKTHASRVFEKLGAKRRTQAVQLGKEFGLLR